jgi:hypothetical protein
MSAPHIFVSYASEDRDTVAELVRLLEDSGFNVWWDRNITTGRAFDRDIEEALDAAHCVLVVWSEASVDSDWVRTEAAEGLDRNILVPVALGDVRPPLAFRRLQTLRLDGLSAASVLPVAEVVRSLMPASQAPENVKTEVLSASVVRTRPMLSFIAEPSRGTDSTLDGLTEFLTSLLAEYFANWSFGGGITQQPEEADYVVRISIASDTTHRRIGIGVEHTENARRWNARITTDAEPTLDNQESIAAAVYQWILRQLNRDMADRFEQIAEDEHDYWALMALAVPSRGEASYKLLQRAVEMEPKRGLAYAKLAHLGVILRSSRSVAPGLVTRKLLEHNAKEAVRLEPSNPDILIASSYSLSLIGEPTLALSLIEAAMALLPPAGHWTRFPLVRLGRGDEAMLVIQNESKWGLPVNPEMWASAAEAEAVRRNYTGVEEVARRGLMRAGMQEMAVRAHYANALACLDRDEEAAEQWRLACERAPGLTVDLWRRGWAAQVEDESLVDCFAGGLMKLNLA